MSNLPQQIDIDLFFGRGAYTCPAAFFFTALLLTSCAAAPELQAAPQPTEMEAPAPIVDQSLYRVRLSSLTNPDIYQEVDLRLNEPTNVPGMEVRLTALEYFPNYSYSFTEKRPENLSDSPINPGLRMTMTTEGLTLPPFWLFSKRPQFRPFSRMPMHIIFSGQVEPVQKVEDGE